ncbi:Apoptosis-stimulating of p53 protein 2 [Halotydeus destructor]|nr:Apoptosis-stimulating of p53 protein 2 [Halotydeus destructor]
MFTLDGLILTDSQAPPPKRGGASISMQRTYIYIFEDFELQSARTMFGEKVKELSVALTKVDALTRQLEELKKGNTRNSYQIASAGQLNGAKYNQELEKLRQELLYRSKVANEQRSELAFKKTLISQKKNELNEIDQKIVELQERLTRKRQLNQQLSSQIQSEVNRAYVFGHQLPARNRLPLPKSQQIRSQSSIAAVEPIQRQQSVDTSPIKKTSKCEESFSSKQDPKYQTLPYNTKFAKLARPPPRVDKSTTERPSGSQLNDQLNGNGQYARISTHVVTGGPDNGTPPDRPSPSGSNGSSDASSSSSFQRPIYKPSKESIEEYDSQQRNYTESIRVSLSDATPLDSRVNTGGLITTTAKPQSTPREGSTSSPTVGVLPSNPSSISFTSKSAALSASAAPETGGSIVFHLKGPNSERRTVQGSTNLDHGVTSPTVNLLSSTRSDATGSIDWHKVKRRPVVVNNDMEQELEAQMTLAFEAQSLRDHEETISELSSQLSSLDANQPTNGDAITTLSQEHQPSKLDTNDSCVHDAQVAEKVQVEVAEDKGDNVPEIDTTGGNNEDKSTPKLDKSEVTNDNSRKECSPIRRTKGNLKVKSDAHLQLQHQQLGDQGITRRVSFDPLALLLDAALEGELELVKKSASQVSNPSAVKDEGITALHNAICAGHYPIVQYLVEIGCDVNAQDSDGWTPLHCAASCNNLPMVKFLVEHGACIFATTFSDHETAAEKCEEDEEGFDGCSQYLYSVQENLGSLNGGVVFAVYSYDAQNADELSFKDGDQITIIRKNDEEEREWWWAKFKAAEGYVPRNLLGLFSRVSQTRSSDGDETDELDNDLATKPLL